MNDMIVINTENQNIVNAPFKCSGYGLGELTKDIKEPVGLEIGCDIGDTAQFLLDLKNEVKLFSVDPYENYVDWNGRPLNEREYLFNQVMQRFAPYGDRYTLVRKTSDDAAALFEENFFDFIFIDGLHTYEQLTKDCANYYSKLKPGGIFSGHDYTAIEGVRRAADEFAEKMGKQIMITECDVWYWYK